jgi:hypothetical protein
MTDGWEKIKATAIYAGVSPRTMRDWLNRGLRHARLASGTILLKLLTNPSADKTNLLPRFIEGRERMGRVHQATKKDFRRSCLSP